MSEKIRSMGIGADIALAMVVGLFVSWLTDFNSYAVILIYIITLAVVEGIVNYARAKRPSPMLCRADLVMLVCAGMMLWAFFVPAWLDVSGTSFTGGELVYEKHDEIVDAMEAGLFQSNLASLFLIPLAAIGGGLLTLRRLVSANTRRNWAVGLSVFGLIALTYFAIFALENRSVPDLLDRLGTGFRIGFVASVGMALQVAIPRRTVILPWDQWRETWHEVKKNRWAYVFISPFFFLFFIFGFFPILFSIYISFQRWNGYKPMQFIGLKHYTWISQWVLGNGAGGKVFWKSIENGVYLFLMYVPLMTFMAIVLAVILNSQRVRGFRFYRTLIFAPYVTSMVAAGFTFRLMLMEDGGLFNLALEQVGLPGLGWLEDEWLGRASLCMLVIWGWLGYNMVLMLAGLQTIPKDLSEAALVDGANQRQILFRITIPLLRPMILFSVVLSTMGTFALFNEVMALTNGTAGPRRATLTPVVHIYNEAFDNFWFGRASAQAYVYFLLIFILTIFQFRYLGREES